MHKTREKIKDYLVILLLLLAALAMAFIVLVKLRILNEW